MPGTNDITNGNVVDVTVRIGLDDEFTEPLAAVESGLNDFAARVASARAAANASGAAGPTVSPAQDAIAAIQADAASRIDAMVGKLQPAVSNNATVLAKNFGQDDAIGPGPRRAPRGDQASAGAVDTQSSSQTEVSWSRLVAKLDPARFTEAGKASDALTKSLNALESAAAKTETTFSNPRFDLGAEQMGQALRVFDALGQKFDTATARVVALKLQANPNYTTPEPAQLPTAGPTPEFSPLRLRALAPNALLGGEPISDATRPGAYDPIGLSQYASQEMALRAIKAQQAPIAAASFQDTINTRLAGFGVGPPRPPGGGDGVGTGGSDDGGGGGGGGSGQGRLIDGSLEQASRLIGKYDEVYAAEQKLQGAQVELNTLLNLGFLDGQRAGDALIKAYDGAIGAAQRYEDKQRAISAAIADFQAQASQSGTSAAAIAETQRQALQQAQDQPVTRSGQQPLIPNSAASDQAVEIVQRLVAEQTRLGDQLAKNEIGTELFGQGMAAADRQAQATTAQLNEALQQQAATIATRYDAGSAAAQRFQAIEADITVLLNAGNTAAAKAGEALGTAYFSATTQARQAQEAQDALSASVSRWIAQTESAGTVAAAVNNAQNQRAPQLGGSADLVLNTAQFAAAKAITDDLSATVAGLDAEFAKGKLTAETYSEAVASAQTNAAKATIDLVSALERANAAYSDFLEGLAAKYAPGTAAIESFTGVQRDLQTLLDAGKISAGTYSDSLVVQSERIASLTAASEAAAVAFRDQAEAQRLTGLGLQAPQPETQLVQRQQDVSAAFLAADQVAAKYDLATAAAQRFQAIQADIIVLLNASSDAAAKAGAALGNAYLSEESRLLAVKAAQDELNASRDRAQQPGTAEFAVAQAQANQPLAAIAPGGTTLSDSQVARAQTIRDANDAAQARLAANTEISPETRTVASQAAQSTADQQSAALASEAAAASTKVAAQADAEAAAQASVAAAAKAQLASQVNVVAEAEARLAAQQKALTELVAEGTISEAGAAANLLPYQVALDKTRASVEALTAAHTALVASLDTADAKLAAGLISPAQHLADTKVAQQQFQQAVLSPVAAPAQDEAAYQARVQALNKVAEAQQNLADHTDFANKAVAAGDVTASQGAAEVARYQQALDNATAAQQKQNDAYATYQAAITKTNAKLAEGSISESQATTQRKAAQEQFQTTIVALDKTSTSGFGAAFAIGQVSREVVVLGHEIIQGNFSRLAGSLIVITEYLGAFREKIVEIGAALFGTAAGLAALGAIAVIGTLTAIGVSAQHAAAQLVDLATQARATRSDFGQAAIDVQAANRDLLAPGSNLSINAKNPSIQPSAGTAAGTSISKKLSVSSAELIPALAAIRDTPEFVGDKQDLEELGRVANDLAAVFQITLPEAGKKLASAMHDPTAAANELAKQGLPGVNDALAKQIEFLQKTGQSTEAYTVLIDHLAPTVRAAAEAHTPLGEALARLGHAFDDAGTKGKSFGEGLGKFIVDVISAAVNKLAGFVEYLNALDKKTAAATAGATPGGITPAGQAVLQGSLFFGMGGDSGFASQGTSIRTQTEQFRKNPAFASLFVPRSADQQVLVSTSGQPGQSPDTLGRGVGQVTPQTARSFGVDTAFIDESRGQNLVIAMAKLLDLSQKPGATDTSIIKGYGGFGDSPKSQVALAARAAAVAATDISQLPSEEVAFVKAVLGAWGKPELADLMLRLIPGESGDKQFKTSTDNTGVVGVQRGKDIAIDAGGVANESTPGFRSAAQQQYDALVNRTGQFAGTPSTKQNELAATINELEAGKAAVDKYSLEWVVLDERQKNAQKSLLATLTPFQSLERAAAEQAVLDTAGYGAATKYAEARNKVAQAARDSGDNDASAAEIANQYALTQQHLTAEFENHVKEVETSTTSQDRLNTATLAAIESGSTYAVALQHEIDLTQATKDTDAYSIRNTAERARQVRELTGALDDAAAKNKAGTLNPEIAQQEEQIRLTQAQISVVGESAEAQARYIAVYSARAKLTHDGISEDTQQGQIYVANADALAKLTEKENFYKQSLSDVASALTASFDSLGQAISNAFVSGQGSAVNFHNAIKSLLGTLATKAFELAFVNPVTNALGIGPTKGTLFGALEASAQKPQPQAAVLTPDRVVAINADHHQAVLDNTSALTRLTGAITEHGAAPSGVNAAADLVNPDGSLVTPPQPPRAASAAAAAVGADLVNPDGSLVTPPQPPAAAAAAAVAAAAAAAAAANNQPVLERAAVQVERPVAPVPVVVTSPAEATLPTAAERTAVPVPVVVTIPPGAASAPRYTPNQLGPDPASYEGGNATPAARDESYYVRGQFGSFAPVGSPDEEFFQRKLGIRASDAPRFMEVDTGDQESDAFHQTSVRDLQQRDPTHQATLQAQAQADADIIALGVAARLKQSEPVPLDQLHTGQAYIDRYGQPAATAESTARLNRNEALTPVPVVLTNPQAALAPSNIDRNGLAVAASQAAEPVPVVLANPPANLDRNGLAQADVAQRESSQPVVVANAPVNVDRIGAVDQQVLLDNTAALRLMTSDLSKAQPDRSLPIQPPQSLAGAYTISTPDTKISIDTSGAPSLVPGGSVPISPTAAGITPGASGSIINVRGVTGIGSTVASGLGAGAAAVSESASASGFDQPLNGTSANLVFTPGRRGLVDDGAFDTSGSGGGGEIVLVDGGSAPQGGGGGSFDISSGAQTSPIAVPGQGRTFSGGGIGSTIGNVASLAGAAQRASTSTSALGELSNVASIVSSADKIGLLGSSSDGGSFLSALNPFSGGGGGGGGIFSSDGSIGSLFHGQGFFGSQGPIGNFLNEPLAGLVGEAGFATSAETTAGLAASTEAGALDAASVGSGAGFATEASAGGATIGGALSGIGGGFALGSLAGGFLQNALGKTGPGPTIGAGGGAAAGAIIGSVFPVIGTAIGALIGGLIGGAGGGLIGPKPASPFTSTYVGVTDAGQLNLGNTLQQGSFAQSLDERAAANVAVQQTNSVLANNGLAITDVLGVNAPGRALSVNRGDKASFQIGENSPNGPIDPSKFADFATAFASFRFAPTTPGVTSQFFQDHSFASSDELDKVTQSLNTFVAALKGTAGEGSTASFINQVSPMANADIPQRLADIQNFVTQTVPQLTNTGSLSQSIAGLNTQYTAAITLAHQLGYAEQQLTDARDSAIAKANATAQFTLQQTDRALNVRYSTAFDTLNTTPGSPAQSAAQKATALYNFDNVTADSQRKQLSDQLLATFGDAYQNTADFAAHMALLEKTLGEERLVIAKGFDDQIATQNKQSQNSVLSLSQSLLSYVRGLSSSLLSPQQQYSNAQAEFQQQSAKAQGGDFTALQNITGYADNFLSTTRALFGSGAQYFQNANAVLDVLQNFATTPVATLTSYAFQQIQKQLMLDQTDQLLAGLGQLGDILNLILGQIQISPLRPSRLTG